MERHTLPLNGRPSKILKFVCYLENNRHGREFLTFSYRMAGFYTCPRGTTLCLNKYCISLVAPRDSAHMETAQNLFGVFSVVNSSWSYHFHRAKIVTWVGQNGCRSLKLCSVNTLLLYITEEYYF